MIERAMSLAFAAGLSVFPGGRVDAQDEELARAIHAVDPAETAARIAAVRETIEEVGLSIGLNPVPVPAELDRIRAALREGADFGGLLQASRIHLDLDALTPWARWRPAHAHKRIFDTRFYITQLPGSADHASVDEGESARLSWDRPGSFLDDADAGKITLMYPTRRNLERLSLFDSFAATRDHALSLPARAITPWFETREGAEHLCIPQDAGYPVTSQDFATVDRG